MNGKQGQDVGGTASDPPPSASTSVVDPDPVRSASFCRIRFGIQVLQVFLSQVGKKLDQGGKYYIVSPQAHIQETV
jgi:hypothetical protein